MKKLSLSIATLAATIILAACSSDEPVNNLQNDETVENLYEVKIEDARKDLLDILSVSDVNSSRLMDGVGIRTISSSFELPISGSDSRNNSIETKIYIFNFANNAGFAIMSADKRLPSLLALAESGSLNPNDTIDNPGFDIFFDDIPQLTLQPAVNENLDLPGGNSAWSNRTEYGDWQTTIYNNNSRCYVKWHQGDTIPNSQSYNKFTPLENNKNTVTGCVATALAQFMSVHKQPSSYTYDGETYTFDWDAMTEFPSIYPWYPDSRDMIAHLMVLLGKPENLNVTYGLKQSGASSSNVQRTLQAFGYSNIGKYVAYNSKAIEEISTEIKNGYPALVGGNSFRKKHYVLGIHTSTSYSGGHLWLVDGLMVRTRIVTQYKAGEIEKQTTQSETYFRCNWGWGGLRDGYYLSSAFSANKGYVFGDNYTGSRSDMESGEDNNYQYNLKAIYGIRK